MPTPVNVTPQSPLLQQSAACIYCHADIAVNDQVMLCDTCQSPHHADCWQANNRRCATYGCVGAKSAVAREVVPPPPQRRNAPPQERQRSRQRGFPWWLIGLVIWGCSIIEDRVSSPPVPIPLPMPTAIFQPTPITQPVTQPISPLETPAMPETTALPGALVGQLVTIVPPAVTVAVPNAELGLVALDESGNMVRGFDIAGSADNPIRTTTNESGEFAFDLVNPGRYVLFVAPNNEAERVASVDTGGDVFTIIDGQITDVGWSIARPTIPTPTAEPSQ